MPRGFEHSTIAGQRECVLSKFTVKEYKQYKYIIT